MGVNIIIVGKRPITTKWVYKIKNGINGNPNKYKAQLVAKGVFIVRESCILQNIYAWNEVRNNMYLVVVWLVYHKWNIAQMDVWTTLLNGELHEEGSLI